MCVKLRVLEVRDQVVGQLAIVEEAVAVSQPSFPGAEMDLVDGDRAVERLPLRPGRHPLVVAPGELGEVPDDRRGLGAEFGGEPVGVGLLHEVAVVAALDLELVDLTLAEIGDEELPDSGRRRGSSSDAGGRPSG